MTHYTRRSVFAILLIALLLSASAAEPRRSNLDAGDAQLADESESNDWLAYGRPKGVTS